MPSILDVTDSRGNSPGLVDHTTQPQELLRVVKHLLNEYYRCPPACLEFSVNATFVFPVDPVQVVNNLRWERYVDQLGYRR